MTKATPKPARRRRSAARIAGHREAAALLATLGRELRATRVARGLTQAQLADLVGLEQARISELERGKGGGSGVEVWIALGVALERPLAIAFTRDSKHTMDAGHLGPQELVLRLGRRNGIPGTFELATNPANPSRMVVAGTRLFERRGGG